jgi:diguanylate cyclase (GGDEF)-like protein
MMSELTEGKPRILIADDEPQIRTILRHYLGTEYECREVGSAEEALTLLESEQFALILSDIMMGGLTGLDMVPLVLERAPDTVIILISGVQSVESAIEALRVGAFDYITKPFESHQVEAAVRRAIEHYKLRAAKRGYEAYLEDLIKQRTAEITHLSNHDVLTDLPNRILFEDRLAQALLAPQRGKRTLAVMFLNLDRFKVINDTLGPAVGDWLLQGVAERLARHKTGADTLARLGSDEFGLLLTQIDRIEDAIKIYEAIAEALEPPFFFGTHKFHLTASTGISFFPQHGEDAPMLLKNAGSALYRAKKQGGNTFQIYAADMTAQALRRIVLEDNLRQALDREEFVVYYQPQVTIDSRRLVGMESLVRWQHREQGLVPPGEFIPLAEDTGLIVPIGEWVLRTACAQMKAWADAGAASLSVSVNLSPRQFRHSNLVEMVGRELEVAGLDPSCLELELTESSVMKNPGSAIETLRELRAMGIKIAIDDFGTGYSSLSYLKNFPITTLKIDRSFVNGIATDPVDAAIVKAIITLAHSLDLTVVAEGVETEDQVGLLRQLGCDQMQGYLFSTPLSADVFARTMLAGHGLVGNGLRLDAGPSHGA